MRNPLLKIIEVNHITGERTEYTDVEERDQVYVGINTHILGSDRTTYMVLCLPKKLAKKMPNIGQEIGESFSDIFEAAQK